MRRLSMFVCVLVVVVALVCPSATYAALTGAPNLLSYEGKLYDAQGVVKPDGSYTVTFRIYDLPAAPTGQRIWEEQDQVYAWKGVFHTLLGDSTSLDSVPWASDKVYYLGIQVAGDPEMTPRQQIVSVPFAMKAGDAAKLAGYPVMNPGSPQLNEKIVRLDTTGKISGSLLTTDASVPGTALRDGAVTTAKIADSAVATSKIQNGAVTAEKAPALIELFGHPVEGLGPNGTTPPIDPGQLGKFKLQAGSTPLTMDSNGIGYIQFPTAFEHGVVTVLATFGEYHPDILRGAYCSIALSPSTGAYGVSNTGFHVAVTRSEGPYAGGSARVNWIAIGW